MPVALKANEKKIEEIKKALTQKQEAVKGLERKTKSEYKDISELQRSGTKRFLLRLKVGAESKKLFPKWAEFTGLITVLH